MSTAKPMLGQDVEMLAPDTALWHLAGQDRFHDFLRARYLGHWNDVEQRIYPEWAPHIAVETVARVLGNASIADMETQKFKTGLGYMIKDFDDFISLS